jgi:hypothetical protein
MQSETMHSLNTLPPGPFSDCLPNAGALDVRQKCRRRCEGLQRPFAGGVPYRELLGRGGVRAVPRRISDRGPRERRRLQLRVRHGRDMGRDWNAVRRDVRVHLVVGGEWRALRRPR